MGIINNNYVRHLKGVIYNSRNVMLMYLVLVDDDQDLRVMNWLISDGNHFSGRGSNNVVCLPIYEDKRVAKAPII